MAGEIAAFDATPLVAAALSGLLAVSSGARVNQVNAPLLARQRGLAVTEQRNPDAGRYASLLTLRGATTVAGTVASGEPRLVRLGEHWLDMALSTSMLITRHHDRPGTIGAVGGILGTADINISGMHLARSTPRADAFMILALDEPVPRRRRRPAARARRRARPVGRAADVSGAPRLSTAGLTAIARARSPRRVHVDRRGPLPGPG